jgi:hypothetical protein
LRGRRVVRNAPLKNFNQKYSQIMTRPRVKPIDWQLMSQNPMRRGQVWWNGRNAIKHDPRTLEVAGYQPRPRREGKMRASAPDEVSDGDHDDAAVLELGCDDTGDEERDDLERATGAVEQGGVEFREAHALDDGARKVGEHAVRDRGAEHGELVGARRASVSLRAADD